MEVSEDTKFRRLRRFNIIMGFLHLIQGALILALSNKSSLQVMMNYLQFDPVTEQPEMITETLFNLQLGPMVALFLFLSAIAHFSVSLPKGYDWYVRNLKKGMNPARWAEYSVSSSVMIIVIAMLVGIWELSALILIFALNATMIFFGHVMELHNQTTEKTNWTSYIMGCFSGLIVWIVLGIYFFTAILKAGDVPTFVYLIFITIAIFFNIFAVNMFLQYKKVGKWKDYLYGERFYIILSLVAKSALAWEVFGGTLR